MKPAAAVLWSGDMQLLMQREFGEVHDLAALHG